MSENTVFDKPLLLNHLMVIVISRPSVEGNDAWENQYKESLKEHLSDIFLARAFYRNKKAQT